MAVVEIESQGCLEEVIRRGAVSVRIVVGDRLRLAVEDALRSAVVVACADVELMADWIDGRRLPDRATAVAPRVAAVIRHYIGLPKQLAGVGIECHHAAAEGAAMIDGEGRDWGRVIEERQRLFLRRDTHINDITE